MMTTTTMMDRLRVLVLFIVVTCCSAQICPTCTRAIGVVVHKTEEDGTCQEECIRRIQQIAYLANGYSCGACDEESETAPTPEPAAIPNESPVATPGSETRFGQTQLCPDADDSSYALCLDLRRVNEEDQAIFLTAAGVWGSKITESLDSVTLPRASFTLCGAMPRTVDDTYICGVYDDIDGEFGILGSAFVQYTRRSNGLPVAGVMQFDTADMARLRETGTLESVIIHEMGHLIGLGSLWSKLGVTGDGESCPYRGANANREWSKVSGCTAAVPTEQDGGGGTKCGHFDETCLKNEIMTGFLNNAAGIFSAVTIGSMEDLGYSVDYSAASKYDSSDIDSSCNCNRRLRGNVDSSATAFSSTTRVKQRQLSRRDRRTARKYGLGVLKRAKELQSNQTDSEDISFTGGDYVSVLFMDKQSLVHTVEVWPDELDEDEEPEDDEDVEDEAIPQGHGD